MTPDRTIAETALDASPEVFTTVTNGHAAVWHVPEPPDVISIGRDVRCEICIPDEFVSRVHALLVPVGPGWTVVDVGSRNGLHFEGRRFTRRRLVPGQAVELGSTLLRWWLRDVDVDTHEFDRLRSFTPAQLRVLDAAAIIIAENGGGQADAAAIARQLIVSVNTVRTHLSVLAAELDVRGRSRGERITAVLEAARARGWEPTRARDS